MSDLLAPILRLLEDEVETFWCFVGLMEMEERMFEISQGLMKTQLECLGKLIKFLYPNFWTFLGIVWFTYWKKCALFHPMPMIMVFKQLNFTIILQNEDLKLNISVSLEKKEAQNLYFCFRWLLISFKREFDYSDVMTLWEVINFTICFCLNIRKYESSPTCQLCKCAVEF